MNFHVVGGFLGSGKTTAIIAAAKYFMAAGKKVGIVTNDKGKYLVDTAFYRSEDLPTVEVAGGCFRCNYDELEAQLTQLEQDEHPDMVFAESVGSCADLMATVVQPLLELHPSDTGENTFTVFADSELLLIRLQGEELPFSDKINYLFDKQIEEARLLIINKIDLLTDEERAEIEQLARSRYPDKTILLQNSLEPGGAADWAQQLQGGALMPQEIIDLDYDRYSEGEKELAWLEKEVRMTVPPGQGRDVFVSLVEKIIGSLQERSAPIGHLKFYIRSGDVEAKLSFPLFADGMWKAAIPELPDREVYFILNARVVLPAKELYQLVRQALADTEARDGVHLEASGVRFFHPDIPVRRPGM
ncbi:MAG: hypothetical protein JXA25_10405 [Anaerolineales bacterium]|nr:hypothetical protein [Anaerolineales bacterium]